MVLTRLPPPDAATQAPVMDIDMRAHGSSGLNAVGGYILEDLQSELQGRDAVQMWRRMGDYDPVCSGVLYSMDKLVRRVRWRVNPASARPQDREAAEFLESCMHDMDMPWSEHISEFMSMCQFGFSLNELVWKRRCGNSPQKAFRSKYADGRIAWRYMPTRAQDTIVRWDIDPCGDILGAIQMAPPDYRNIYLSMSRCLLFRTSTHKNNPEGKSIFKGAFTSWYRKNALERFEAMGLERDLAGIPKVGMPPEYMHTNAAPQQKAMYESVKRIADNVRQDEQASVIYPLLYDANGNEMFKFELMNSGGSRSFDTDKIIQRYDHRIAMSVLADFLLMGQSSSSTGSLAMHQDKSGIFGTAISAFLDIIAQTLQKAVAKLFAMNDFAITEYPEIVHDEIESVDIAALGDFISKMATSGMPLFPNPALEKRIMELTGLPVAADYETPTQDVATVQEPIGVSENAQIREIHDDSSLQNVDGDVAAPEDDPEQLPQQFIPTPSGQALSVQALPKPYKNPGYGSNAEQVAGAQAMMLAAMRR